MKKSRHWNSGWKVRKYRRNIAMELQKQVGNYQIVIRFKCKCVLYLGLLKRFQDGLFLLTRNAQFCELVQQNHVRKHDKC